MPKLQILDTSGHRELTWQESGQATALAKVAFDEHLKKGYSAFKTDGEGGKIKAFDPQADIVMVPAIQGG